MDEHGTRLLCLRASARTWIAVLVLLATSLAATAPDGATGATSSVAVTLTVASATTITNSCGQQAGRSVGTVVPGVPALSATGTEVCRIGFSSTNDTSALRIYQADREGTAMARWSTTWDRRRASTANLSDIDAGPGGRVVAVGNAATVRVSSDSGASWSGGTNTGGIWSTLNDVDVAAADPNVAWVVGHDGSVLRTADGGATWQARPISESVQLRGVLALDASNAFVGGSGGRLLRTTDAGLTWTQVPIGSSATVDSIVRRSASELWLAGNNNLVRRSTDGGATWSAPAAATPWVHHAEVAVTGTSAVWVAGWVGGDARIAHSTDGGATWQNRSSYLGEGIEGLAAVSATEAWVVGRGGTIMRTTTSGSSWSRLAGLDTSTVTGITMASNGDVLTSTFAGDVQRSADGGGTWTMAYEHGAAPALSSVAAAGADRRLLVAVGDGGAVRRSTDLGTTWSVVPSGSMSHLRGVSLADDGTGWAVGHRGTILRTVDAGATWSTQSSGGVLQDLFSVSAVDARTGWAAGRQGTVLRTTDGGATWLSVPSGTSFDLRAVSAPTADVVWIGGAGGALRRTADGGASWVAQLSGSDDDTIFAIHAVSTTRAIAANDWTGVIRTTDAGTTWEPHGFAGVGGEKGLAVSRGGDSVIIAGEWGQGRHTSDGGVAWSSTGNPGHYLHQRSAVFIDANRFVAVGENDAISVSRSRNPIPDFGALGSRWDSATNGLFAACLQAVGPATTSGAWTVDAANVTGRCEPLASDPWNAIPTTPTTIGRTSAAGAAGSVDLVWGMQAAAAQEPGTYSATVSFESIAPAA